MKTPLFVTLVTTLVAAAIPSPTAGLQQRSGSPDVPRPGIVTGTVLSGTSGRPLADVAVTLEGTTLGALTTGEGRFFLLDVPAGPHVLVTTLIGFGEQRREITVRAGQAVDVGELFMFTAAVQLEGLVVTGTASAASRREVRSPAELAARTAGGSTRAASRPGAVAPVPAGTASRREVGNSVSVITSEDIRAQGMSTMDDVLRGNALGLQLDGSEGENSTESPITIRGMSSINGRNRPLIYVDGVRLSDLTAEGVISGPPATDLHLIDPADIDRVEVIKGGAATTLYGAGASGGVIQIFTKGWTPPHGWPAPVHPEPIDRESYEPIDENRYLGPLEHPLSTFSIDVDRASYANVRRFVTRGELPPADAVRIEELVNYFDYDDTGPEVDAPPFRITTEVGPAPWHPEHHLVRIGLKAREIDLEDLPPSNLVFLIDVSGSMQRPEKLPLLKDALGLLVEELREEDRVAIVVYAGAAGLVLESTPGTRKARILASIEALRAGGSTAGGAGIELAYRVAAENHVEGGNNRVILATDGDFNVGPSSDEAMVELIERKRTQGTFLSVLGFGTGNLQDAKMEKIADHGNGNFAYIDSRREAEKLLVEEMGGTLFTVAKDVKIQVEFNPARVESYRLIGYENRLLESEDFADDRKDAGELGAGHTVTALYEVIPVGASHPEGAEVEPLRYQKPEPSPEALAEDELLYVKLRWKEPEAERSERIDHLVMVRDLRDEPSAELRFAAAVAAWGMLLRGSEYSGEFTLGDVADLASDALGDDSSGHRSEFLSLVWQSRRLEELVALRQEAQRNAMAGLRR